MKTAKDSKQVGEDRRVVPLCIINVLEIVYYLLFFRNRFYYKYTGLLYNVLLSTSTVNNRLF